MTTRTFTLGDLTRETALPAEAVALITQGWQETTPTPAATAEADAPAAPAPTVDTARRKDKAQ